jgi:CRISPR/Cas system CSM-associated protein Csm2 small subunit
MKECLNCKKEFQERRSTARFCSNKCRSAFNRGTSGNRITKMQMREMFNAIMGAVNSINAKNGQPEAVTVVFEMPSEKTPKMNYNNARATIEASTSSYQLEDAWRQIKKQDWPGWQMKELTKLKDLQQTKIDF